MKTRQQNVIKFLYKLKNVLKKKIGGGKKEFKSILQQINKDKISKDAQDTINIISNNLDFVNNTKSKPKQNEKNEVLESKYDDELTKDLNDFFANKVKIKTSRKH